ncbi:MAG: tRNA (adenosine(37)-N6)-threonylcarbamoyltransferase complex ATPase subunit type 1 TsaE [Patescibacteria group bacterium]
MQKVFVTKNFRETRRFGRILALEIKKDAIICLSGDLGSGKTTFTQGFLRGLKVKGPYTSSTFVIMKQYKPLPIPPLIKGRGPGGWVKTIYHIDAYRVDAKDILNLGWKEMLAEKNNIIIIEWADRIRKIIPRGALWIKFEWVDENKRKIRIMSFPPPLSRG